VEQIIELLKTRDRFVIAGHIGPDGDTIGSCLGLAMALDKLGKNAVVVLEATAAKYRVIPGREYLNHGPLEALSFDVFIAMDCADVDRLGAAKALFDRAATTICIDHHKTNTGFADYNLIDGKASSTAEMVYGIIEQLTEVDQRIATAIYCGIVGDTGGFRYVSTSTSTMAVTAKLMATGIPFTELYSEMLLRRSFEAAKAFGLALGAARQAMGGRIVYTYMTAEMLASVGAVSSDLDTLVEYLMNTRGADVALFLYERQGVAKEELATKMTRDIDVARPETVDETPTGPGMNDTLPDAVPVIRVNGTLPDAMCATGIDGTSPDAMCATGIDSTSPDAMCATGTDGTSPDTGRGKVKASMRSRGLDVGRIAASLGGGGHRLAAGCTLVGSMEDIMPQVLTLLEQELEAYDS